MDKFSKKLNITLLLFVILSTILIAVSCGSSDSSFINTNQNVNTPVSFTYTPTPALTSVPVNAYLYLSNTSLEDGENVEQTTVLDIPAINPDSSGSTPLLTQLSALQQENPQDWQGEDMKELSDKLAATLNQSQVLPQTAKVFTVYQDSLNESPIPVNNEGYISGQAVVGDTDTNVQLEVSLDDDHYIDVETIIPSNNLISSDATGATLKSCPEKVFALPGEVIIIQISSTTGINLKEAGLTFSLRNPNLGCITSKPIFLEICGKKKYEKAYCLFYAKKNLTTPVDSVITVKTSNGLQLDIFTEIIKSTASISGKVFTGGKPLIKGYVKSIGPKAFCKLDSSGSYTLPRVFCGHFRKIIATYWIEDNNGKKIRHREEKIIDFFNSNLTNFNFGQELLTPTPTSTPSATPTPRPHTSRYYDVQASKVIYQFNIWKSQLELKEAVHMTVNWINKNLPSPPIPEGIEKALIDEESETDFWIYFSDGMCVRIANISNYSPSSVDPNIPLPKELKKDETSKGINSFQKAGTVGSTRTLILAPFEWLENPSFYGSKYRKPHIEIADNLKKASYEFDRAIVDENFIPKFDLNADPNFTLPDGTLRLVPDPLGYEITDYTLHLLYEGHKIPSEKIQLLEPLKNIHFTPDEFSIKLKGLGFSEDEKDDIKAITAEANNIGNPDKGLLLYWAPDNLKDKIITINDYLNMKDYGIILITTHGLKHGILGGIIFENDEYTEPWLNSNEVYDPITHRGLWELVYFSRSTRDYNRKAFFLTKNFFSQQSYNNSIIYMNACYSWELRDAFINHGAKVYFGHTKSSFIPWFSQLSCLIFSYMMYGTAIYDPNNTTAHPKSARDAYNVLNRVTFPANQVEFDLWDLPYDPNEVVGCTLKLDTHNTDPNDSQGIYDDTYFPAPVTITIEKNNTK